MEHHSTDSVPKPPRFKSQWPNLETRKTEMQIAASMWCVKLLFRMMSFASSWNLCSPAATVCFGSATRFGGAATAGDEALKESSCAILGTQLFQLFRRRCTRWASFESQKPRSEGPTSPPYCCQPFWSITRFPWKLLHSSARQCHCEQRSQQVPTHGAWASNFTKWQQAWVAHS